MNTTPSPVKRTITVFTLAMINVAAIGSIKSWPFTAEYGFSSIFYLLLAALVFFLPLTLITAELATSFPRAGGVFAWVKEAFGHRMGFLAVWLQWIENVVWYPTILSFIAVACAYAFKPEFIEHKIYTIIAILLIFWGATFANLSGMKTSSWISTVCVIIGTFLPAGLIITLGFLWYSSNQPLHITFTWDSFIPDMRSIDNLVFFTGVMFSFCGMEMSAVHVNDVKHPKRDFPRAILLSGILLFFLSALGILAIASIVPRENIDLLSGSLQVFAYSLEAYHLHWLTPCIALLIAIGAFGSMSTWIVGPTKGLLAAAQSGDLPPYFRAVNAKNIPNRLLITQAIIVSILSSVFLFMPNLSSAFWILTALVAQVYLIMYILMFASVIKLRYKAPKLERPYKVPGGSLGVWIFASVGILSCLFAIGVGFFPPPQIQTGNIFFYFFFLTLGIILTCCAPTLILLFQKPHWKKNLPHEVSKDIS